MTELQRYLAEEIAVDHPDGIVTRREALRRLGLLGLGATAASAQKYERLVAQQQHELERVASLTADEAKELLIKQIENDARRDAANLLKRLDTEAREKATDKAKQYITEAIQRSAAEHAVETTVSVVDLPSDDLKGRIIGREGRNIRALEAATGIDLIVDDTPETVVISGHNPIRREVARLSLEKLISDGRIHPGRIEEVVRKSEQELDEAIREAGQKAIFDVGVHGVHPELIKLLMNILRPDAGSAIAPTTVTSRTAFRRMESSDRTVPGSTIGHST